MKIQVVLLKRIRRATELSLNERGVGVEVENGFRVWGFSWGWAWGWDWAVGYVVGVGVSGGWVGERVNEWGGERAREWWGVTTIIQLMTNSSPDFKFDKVVVETIRAHTW